MKLRKHIFSFAAILFAACIFLTSCSNLSIPTNANTAFQNFTLKLFEQDVTSTTIGLHYTLQDPEAYGIKEFPVTFGSFDINETAALASLENCNAALKKFPYKLLSKENQLTYDVLSSYVDTAIKGVPFSIYEEPLNPVTGVQAQLPVLLAEYPFAAAADVETYLALIQTTPEYFNSLIRLEKKKSDSGLFMSDDTVDAILEQCNAFLGMKKSNYLLSTFEKRISALASLSEEQKADFIARNQQLLTTAILPAYEALTAALTDLKGTGNLQRGLCNLPKGAEYYAYLVARDTGSSRTVKEIQQQIQTQLASDLSDMRTIASRHKPVSKETFLSSDASPSSIIRDLEAGISKSFPKPTNVKAQIKYVPKDMEPYLSPAFYMIPSIDNTADNVIYINQAHTADGLNLFTTLAHEGYPGHLYQTTYFAAKKPAPIRSLLNFSGYVEGWATYAEMCSYYLSTLEKPYAALLQKNSSVILGLYASADIGIHADNWDLEQTTRFFHSYGIKDKNAVQDIYDLIIADPANYLKYYVGYLEILELKKKTIQEKQGSFSQKSFHKAVLDIGPAPFDVIEKHLFP